MQETIREAVGVFHDPQALDAAIAELEVTAFPRQDISVLDSDKRTQEKYGIESYRARWMEDNPDTPRGVRISPEEKTIGASFVIGAVAYFSGCLAAILAKDSSTLFLLEAIASGSLAGAALGSIFVLVIGGKLMRGAQRQLRKGGFLLWVRTPDLRREKIAQDILRRHGGDHVHVHDVA